MYRLDAQINALGFETDRSRSWFQNPGGHQRAILQQQQKMQEPIVSLFHQKLDTCTEVETFIQYHIGRNCALI